jgi:hypothetical protein
MIELKSLERQLEGLKEALEDAKRKDKSLEERNSIITQIKVVEILIEKRKAFLRRNQTLK